MASAQSSRWKSVTMAACHAVEKEQKLAHPLEPLGRGQRESLVDLRHVNACIEASISALLML